MPTFSNSWFRWEDSWSKALAGLADKPNLRYLEVGVYEGRSFLWAFENILTHPSSTGVAVDLFDVEGLRNRFLKNVERAGISDRVETHAGYSNEVLRRFQNQTFDIIYIDASHTAPNVMRDAILAWDLLKNGGVLIFDDYLHTRSFPTELKPEVSIDAFITAFRDELRVVHRGWQVIVERRTDPCPGSSSSLGPYCYYWDWNEASGKNLLVDPRTNAKVPLNDDERTLIEDLLRARPFGHGEIQVSPDIADSVALEKLRARLDI